jgi:putative membrane protein
MMKWLISWLLHAVALIIVAYNVPAISVASFSDALIAAAVIGLVNTLLRPVLVLLTLPVTIITLGLFIFVINGALFYAAGHFFSGFHVGTFMAGMIGAVLYSLIAWVLSTVVFAFDTQK